MIKKLNNINCFLDINTDSDFLIIQPYASENIEEIINSLREKGFNFSFAGVEIKDWDNDLSPWVAEMPFKKANFEGGGSKTLDFIIDCLIPYLEKEYFLNIPIILGGYSLAGLFALWSGYKCNRFMSVVSVSPSIWYHNWIEFIEDNIIKVNNVYLSLGDKEHISKNKMLSEVRNNIIKQKNSLTGVNVVLEWNEGNHFKDNELRLIKGYIWAMTGEGK